MKHMFKFAFFGFAMSLLLTACGSSGNNNSAAPQCPAGMIWNGAQCQYQYGYNGYGNGYNTCPTAGYISTQQGCLPPCPNQPGYGQMPNGACVPPSYNNGYNNGGMYPNYPQTLPYPYPPSYGWPNYGYNQNCRYRQTYWGYYWSCGI